MDWSMQHAFEAATRDGARRARGPGPVSLCVPVCVSCCVLLCCVAQTGPKPGQVGDQPRASTLIDSQSFFVFVGVEASNLGSGRGDVILCHIRTELKKEKPVRVVMKLQCRRLLIPPVPSSASTDQDEIRDFPQRCISCDPVGNSLALWGKTPVPGQAPFAIRRRITRERVPAGWVVSPFAHAPASWASAHPSHLISAHCAHPPPYLFVAVLKLQPRPSRGLRRLHQAIFAHGDGVRPPCPASSIRPRGGLLRTSIRQYEPKYIPPLSSPRRNGNGRVSGHSVRLVLVAETSSSAASLGSRPSQRATSHFA